MTLRAIFGLVLANLTFLGVGAALLWGLGGWRWWTELVRLSGVAYLLGAASLTTLLTVELVLSVPINAATIAVSCIGLAAAGLVLGWRRAHPRPALRPPEWEFPRLSLFVALFVAGIVVYLEALFRAARLTGAAAEWDGWAFWIPKAEAIYFFERFEPEFVSNLPGLSASYPPGLPALHSVVFHAMGASDEVTLHLQYWFYAAGFVAALAGLLAKRVNPTLVFPLLLLVLLMPNLLQRMTTTYADVPLGYLVAVAALLVLLWILERQGWQLAVATILFGGAIVTKREGIALVGCVLLAGFVASWRDWRRFWPRLTVAALVVLALAIPWRVWFMAHGLPSDGPAAGYLGAFGYLERVRPALDLAVTTLFERAGWGYVPLLAAAAVLLAALAGAWRAVVYTGVFAAASIAVATFVVWSDPALPFTQEEKLNPIVRLTGTSVLVLAALTPLLLQQAWSGLASAASSSSRTATSPGPDGLLWRTRSAWAIVLVPALVYPASMLVGYSGQTLPGGLPRFPETASCGSAPISGAKVRVVVGYADSYPAAYALRDRAVGAGLAGTEVEKDGCGGLRVFVDDVPSAAASEELVTDARAASLEPTLEADPD